MLAAAMTPEQIHYLRTVLGVEGFLVPNMDEQVEVITPLEGDVAWPGRVRTTGDVTSASLLVLASDAGDVFPLEGEAGELASKMLQAMKLPANEIAIVEWTRDLDAHRSPEILSTARNTRAKVLLCFGQPALRALTKGVSHKELREGQWFDFEGHRVMTTHAPQELIVSPALKRVAWAHLQMIMKTL